MIYFAMLGLRFALIRRKNVRTLLHVKYNWPLVLIGSFVLEVLLLTISVFGYRVPTGVFEVTLAGVLVGLWTNRRIPEMWIILINLCLNLLRISTHGRFTPMSLLAWHDAGHIIEKFKDSRHAIAPYGETDWPGDWILSFRYVMSPGNIVARIGLVMFIYRNSHKRYIA